MENANKEVKFMHAPIVVDSSSDEDCIIVECVDSQKGILYITYK